MINGGIQDPQNKAGALGRTQNKAGALGRTQNKAGALGRTQNKEWQEGPAPGIYVHIPFCAHRCHYCDFNTYEGLDDLYEPYVDALVRHIEGLPGPFEPVGSIFFGGGTPTILQPEQLARILTVLRDRVAFLPDAEITIEANPETVTARSFEKLLDAGFNRYSMGVQSLSDAVLERLGREHGSATAIQAFEAARAAGVENLNLDLIYGSPWEAPTDWTSTLERVVELGPEHISAYALTVEEGTPLGAWVRSGKAPDVDPDTQAARFEVATSQLRSAGYERYEVSNWAQPGRACAHNVMYWSAGDYLGLGAGAHGHSRGRRYWCERLPRHFIEAARQDLPVEAGYEVLTDDQRALEALMLGLRMTSGVAEAAFERRFGPHSAARRAVIDELVSARRLERASGWLRIPAGETFRGDAVVGALFQAA